MNIGIFDSGLGGLSVLHLALRKFPAENFIYYADRSHVPYGKKTKEQIIGFVDEIIGFFVKQQVDAVVIACNTATSAAAVEMRQKYDLPIIGMEPAVKKALSDRDAEKVLTAATPITVKGEKMNRLLELVDTDHRVDLVALPELVAFAERGEFDSPAVMAYLERELGRFSLQEYSSLVLGCTHFNYFKDSFRRVLPQQVKLIDGNEGTLNHLATSIGMKQTEGERTEEPEYYFSGVKVRADQDLKFIETCMKRLDDMLRID